MTTMDPNEPVSRNGDSLIPGLTHGPLREHFADESSSASEHEVEQVLDDDSVSSSSESDTDSELLGISSPVPTIPEQFIADDDEDEPQSKGTTTAIGTKNEVLEPAVTLPDTTEVDPAEHIEQVGEVQSIIDSVVIVRGTGSQTPSVAVERVLDADSLLVFEDRKVLGYVFETFGPTTLPMYSVRFPTSDDINQTQVQIGRPVYHLPHKSFYVFPRALAMLKGSDASNVHDEEPSLNEVEYSDDEAERAAKQRLKNRPLGPPRRQHGDSEDTLLTDAALPYDAVDPYAVESGTPGPHAKETAPLDPYELGSDLHSNESSMQRPSRIQNRSERMSMSRDSHESRGRGRHNRRGGRPHEGRGVSRGRGRGGPSWRPSGPPPGGTSAPTLNDGQGGQWNPPVEQYSGPWPNTAPSFMNDAGQGYQQQQFVAPHINPRFANAFTYNTGFGVPPGMGSPGQFLDYSWPPQHPYPNSFGDTRRSER